jgi:heme ABC exporter ATP-binding subunit CcmA/heme exporter protein CcmB
VLRGVDLSLASGSITFLHGANGAGKTTLLRALATLQRISSGQAVVAGADVRREPERVRQAVGLVGHAPMLFPALTVEENLRFWARLHGVLDPPARIEAVLEELDLAAVRGRRVGWLSRGYQQRCAIARAMLGRPAVLLLDEPHTALDAAAAERLDGLLVCHAAAGGTVLLASHDPARAADLADGTLHLVDGTIAPEPATSAWSGPSPLPARRAAPRAPGAPAAADAAPVGASSGRPTLAAVVAAVLRKDLLVELREREVVPPVAVFALAVLVVFHFTVGTSPRLEQAVAPGALWVALAFGGFLGLARLTAGDVDAGGWSGLAASPADRGALYLGKFLAGYGFSLILGAVLVPAAVVLMNLPPQALFGLLGVAVLGLAGWQAAGTLLGALSATVRAREVLLPVLMLPLLLPLLVAAVELSAGVLAERPWPDLAPALALVTSYTVVFLVLGVLAYPLILESTA